MLGLQAVCVTWFVVYGYELQPEERVSAAEFDAIVLKCRAIRSDRGGGAEPAVQFDETLAALTDELRSDEPDPAVCEHLLIATYYAAKIDPDVDDEVVAEFRDVVHEYTNHVDTSHPDCDKGGRSGETRAIIRIVNKR